MARYTQARCKLCRRDGMKLFLKGARCNTEKCAFTKRPYAPGIHGKMQSRKPSYYALQLREKQKAKRIYGMLERQFRRFFYIAMRSKGVTGAILMQLLERRLDNVVFRSLMAYSRAHARQFVRHGNILRSGRRVNIPSFLVKEGDIFEIKADDATKKAIKERIETISKERSIPQWINVDKSSLTIEITRLPQREDCTIAINDQFIVELYSK